MACRYQKACQNSLDLFTAESSGTSVHSFAGPMKAEKYVSVFVISIHRKAQLKPRQNSDLLARNDSTFDLNLSDIKRVAVSILTALD